MALAYANAAYWRPLKPPKPTECVEKRSWPGDGQECFPRIGWMIMGWWSSRRPMGTLLRSMPTNIQKHANYAEGVQYATKSFCCGCCGSQMSTIHPQGMTKAH